jgi:hypothetical protein
MLRVEEGRLTAERLAVIRDAINSAPTGSYSFAAALSLLAHIDAVTAERDEWKRLAMRVTSAAWSLAQWNDHNFTYKQLQEWRQMTEDRCKEAEAAWLAEIAPAPTGEAGPPR